MTFSAAAPNLGYLHQLRFALLRALDDETLTIRLEMLDDVEVIHPDGTSALIQLKHVDGEAILTDSSPDLWKTLRIWSEHHRSGKLGERDVLLLITTASAPAESIAADLAIRERSQADVVAKLENIAQTSRNASLRAAFDAFMALEATARLDLVSRITVVDNSIRIAELTSEIERRLAISVNPEHRSAARERLEGWWIEAAIGHLEQRSEALTSAEVFAKTRDIASSFGPQVLPIDFLGARPPEATDPARDRRPFVLQLKAVDANLGRIEKAMLDYYRAFEQRARWAREDLVDGGEVHLYEDRLVDEWERVRLAVENEMDMDAASEQQLREAGREVLRWVELEADVRIRERVTEAYVMRGSYHMLANAGPDYRVWWHPKFKERVTGILESGAETTQ